MSDLLPILGNLGYVGLWVLFFAACEKTKRDEERGIKPRPIPKWADNIGKAIAIIVIVAGAIWLACEIGHIASHI